MNKDRLILIVTIVLISLALFFFIDKESIGGPLNWGEVNPNVNSETEIKGAEIAGQAPDFSLRNLEGQEVSLSDYRGKIVFLNFWVSWCEDCELEMRHFEKIARKYDQVEVLSINVREDRQAVEKFLAEKDLDLNILLDEDGEIGLDYVVGKLPTSFVIDSRGQVANIITRPMDYNEILREIEILK